MNNFGKDVTLGLGIHRPEMVATMEAWMMKSSVIILEEPSNPEFGHMLNREIEPDEYLSNLDIEYPIFSRKMCRLMQRLAANNKLILQIEPYLETLLDIHEFFGDGGDPSRLTPGTIQHQVYMAEKHATAALIDFYQRSLDESFEALINSVRHFARQDAARFNLRDKLRAQSLIPAIENNSDVFIEAGLMHFGLRGLIQQQLSEPSRMRVVFLADDLLRGYGLKGRLYGPGDYLTLLYMFHPNLNWPGYEKLLAARALVYNRICPKNELEADGDIPHLRHEVDCIEQVSRLSFADCRHMYRRLRNNDKPSEKYWASRNYNTFEGQEKENNYE